MRVEQFEYFTTIAYLKSMNLASEKLHVSQQTLSTSMKKLEEELNVQLLVRSHFGVSLTDEGIEFFKIAEQIQKNIADFKMRYAKKEADIKGRLNIYATPAVCASILPKLITIFIKQHPNIEIRIIEKISSEINQAFENDLSENKIMIVNVMMCEGSESDTYQFSKELHYKEFLSEQYVVMTAKDSVLAEYKTVSIDTLLNYPIVVCGTDDKEKSLSYNLLTKWGNPLVCMASSNPFVFIQAIRNGVGVGLISEISLKNESQRLFTEHIKFVSIKEKIESVNYWGTYNDSDKTPIVKTFISFAEENKHLFA